MDIAGEMDIGSRSRETMTPFLNDIDVERDELRGGSMVADPITSSESHSLDQDDDDVDDTLLTSPPSSASASILSMPDPLSSSHTTSQFDTIRGADYASILDSASGLSSPALYAQNSPGNKPLIRSQEPQHVPSPPEHEPRTNSDHFDHDHDHGYGSDSEVESESSFPSVTSSFFFSSPAAVASHGPGDDSNEEDGGDSESSRGIARGLRATQEFIIPSLTLPESLVNPSYLPLETPHASQLQPTEHHSQHPLDLNAVRLLIVTPPDLHRVDAADVDVALISERVKRELEEMSGNTFEKGDSAEIYSVISSGHDLESVLTTVISSFSQNELFTAVVVVSEAGGVPNEMTEVLASLMPTINLNMGPSSSQPSSSATFAVSSVQELHNLLIQRPKVSQQLRTEAVEKYAAWASHRRDGAGNVQLKAIQTIVDRRAARSGSDHPSLAHSKVETVTMSSSQLRSNQSHGDDTSSRAVIDSEGNWRQFKAQWKTSLEDVYSSQQENLSREVAIKLRHIEAGSQDDLAIPETTSEEDTQLRTARLPYTTPSNAGAYPKTRRLSRPKKVRRSPSLSSSPIPATSPSLPATSSLPSTMPSSISLSDAFFVSTDELPDTPLLPPVPLAVAFPFPSSSRTTPLHLLSDNSSRSRSGNRDRARSRGLTESGKRNGDGGIGGGRGSRSPLRNPYTYDSHSLSTPFILDLHATRFDPLHLPSFIALSFSLLAPLRAHMWSAVRRVATRPFRAFIESRSDGEEESGRRSVYYTYSTDQEKEEKERKKMGSTTDESIKLENSFDSINSFAVGGSDQDDDNEAPSSSSSSSVQYLSRLGKVIWPTGVMLVGGFLLGFVVGHLSGL